MGFETATNSPRLHKDHLSLPYSGTRTGRFTPMGPPEAPADTAWRNTEIKNEKREEKRRKGNPSDTGQKKKNDHKKGP